MRIQEIALRLLDATRRWHRLALILSLNKFHTSWNPLPWKEAGRSSESSPRVHNDFIVVIVTT